LVVGIPVVSFSGRRVGRVLDDSGEGVIAVCFFVVGDDGDVVGD
jgi:hypothetical protein